MDGRDVEVVQYLNTPLTVEDLLEIIGRLDDPLPDLVRTDEVEWSECGLEKTDLNDAEKVAAAIVSHPKLMQRPLVDTGESAFIARPPELIEHLD